MKLWRNNRKTAAKEHKERTLRRWDECLHAPTLFLRFFSILHLLSALFIFGATRAPAAIVVLNEDQPGDYTFQSGNTYYIQSQVNIYGTATLMQGTVLKFAGGRLVVGDVNCQTVATNPAIFTARDDNTFGETLADSTGSPSGHYPGDYSAMLEIDATNDISLHDLQFYDAGFAVDLENYADETPNYSIWNIYMKNCRLAFSVNSGVLNLTNVTLQDCGGLADGYDVSGNAVDCTFMNSGFVQDSWSYYFNGFNFRWCVFSNSSLSAFELDIHGDHNGFYNCGTFSDYDYTGQSSWLETNYFGDHWYWLTNSEIEFYLLSTNSYLKSSDAFAQVYLQRGTVFYKGLLINDTNPDDAIWSEYTTSNLNLTLPDSTNGLYTVRVGLYGARDYAPVWQSIDFTIDNKGPALLITNPIVANDGTATLGVPLLQIQGEANERLSSLTYDISNAVAVVTNLDGLVMQQFFDTNQWEFTTNYFHCFDITLATNLNLISIHATDLAGNITTTNLLLNLDYSTRTNPPDLSIRWPGNGMKISGTQFTLNGYVDDPTAKIAATIVDNGGNTNFVTGVIERDGRYWVDNLPLAAGSNYVTLAATDAAGNTTVTNLAVAQSDVTITMDSRPADELWQPYVNLTGYCSDTSCVIWVNGVKANYGSGDWANYWEADHVPVTEGGVAIFTVKAYESGEQQPDGTYVP